MKTIQIHRERERVNQKHRIVLSKKVDNYNLLLDIFYEIMKEKIVVKEKEIMKLELKTNEEV